MFKVMIVDDMDIIKREIKRLKLWGEETGFMITDVAKNGYEALQKLEISPVDLVITDIKMPKIDGLELLQKTLNKNYCSCVVLMSDYDDFSYVRQGLILGAFDYMVKPVEEVELNKILLRVKEFILDKRKAQERIKKIEQRLSEKVEVYFSKVDVEQIVELICNGNTDVFQVISQMINKIGITIRYDLVKIESVLKNILLEIGNGLVKCHGWLGNFWDINEFSNINFTKCNNFDSVTAVFLATIENCVSKIGKLQRGSEKNKIVNEVCKYVLENVEGDISLKYVSNKLFMNRTYISQAFKQKTGITFVEYLTIVKMERAIKLINEGSLKVYEIGDKLGFKDVEYFSKLFKKYTRFTPTEFRHNI